MKYTIRGCQIFTFKIELKTSYFQRYKCGSLDGKPFSITLAIHARVNNIPNIFPKQVTSRKGGVYTDLTPTFGGSETVSVKILDSIKTFFKIGSKNTRVRKL